jgi:hypothetical protein
MSNQTLGSKLLALKERSGLSLKNIAKAAGYRSASSIQRYFSSDYDAEYLPSQLTARLRTALIGFGDPEIGPDDIQRLTEYGFLLDRVSQAPRTPGHLRESRFIECNATFGTEMHFGNADIFMIEDSPRSYLAKPEHLYHRAIDAIYVSSISSMPRYNPGEIVFFERSRPAAIGNDVVVSLALEALEDVRQTAALIGRLVGVSRGSTSIEIYNPRETVELSDAEVDAILPILPASDFLPQLSKSDAYAAG